MEMNMTEHLKQLPIDPLWVIRELTAPIEGYPAPTDLEKKAAELICDLMTQRDAMDRMLQNAIRGRDEYARAADDMAASHKVERDGLRSALEGVMYWDNGKPEWDAAREALKGWVEP
jgi:hypothetical protein